MKDYVKVLRSHLIMCFCELIFEFFGEVPKMIRFWNNFLEMNWIFINFLLEVHLGSNPKKKSEMVNLELGKTVVGPCYRCMRSNYLSRSFYFIPKNPVVKEKWINWGEILRKVRLEITTPTTTFLPSLLSMGIPNSSLDRWIRSIFYREK